MDNSKEISKGSKGDPGDAGSQGPQGIQGPQGPQGDPGPAGQDGAGVSIAGQVDTYALLPDDLGTDDAGDGYLVEADGLLYVWTGTAFPADGSGVEFRGPQGPQGIQGDPGPQGDPGDTGPAGADGARGSKWFTGAGSPSGVTGSVAGDFILILALATFTN